VSGTEEQVSFASISSAHPGTHHAITSQPHANMNATTCVASTSHSCASPEQLCLHLTASAFAVPQCNLLESYQAVNRQSNTQCDSQCSDTDSECPLVASTRHTLGRMLLPPLWPLLAPHLSLPRRVLQKT